MSEPTSSRFIAPNQSTQERLSTNTVGLVHLKDFRKRRAEVLEQQEKEARQAILGTANSTPDRSQTTSPNNVDDEDYPGKQTKKRQKKRPKVLVSFGDDEEGEQELSPTTPVSKTRDEIKCTSNEKDSPFKDLNTASGTSTKAKVAANASVCIVPRAVTKAALRREAAERETLRKEFLAIQIAVKNTELAIPFVFYDGTNIPGGTVRVKKGDFIWVFLDKSRKVGAELGVGGDKNANARRDWARVSVDDLLLVRGSIIIPHHFQFYYFIMNKTLGPGGKRLFNYSSEAVVKQGVWPEEKPAAAIPLFKGGHKVLADVNSLEGVSDDPSFTKVVDRRWYERNKHIYPASVWQEFDPERNYQEDIRRDPGGNAFFFSK